MSQHVPLGIIELGSFEVLSDHGNTTDEDVAADESSGESAEIMLLLQPVSWFKETRTSRHAKGCEKVLKPRNGNDRRDEESPFFDCWEKEA